MTVQVKPSVLHGDLWSGNISGVDGQPSIFDPAVYYGHSEADFGMSWCAGFRPAFYEAYHEVLPPQPGIHFACCLLLSVTQGFALHACDAHSAYRQLLPFVVYWLFDSYTLCTDCGLDSLLASGCARCCITCVAAEKHLYGDLVANCTIHKVCLKASAQTADQRPLFYFHHRFCRPETALPVVPLPEPLQPVWRVLL